MELLTSWLVSWTELLAISTSVMALAIVITAIYAVIQLRHIKKARYSDLLMKLHQTWDSAEYGKSRMLIRKHYVGKTPEEASQNLVKAIKLFEKRSSEEFFMIVRIMNFFENLGYLACEGYLERTNALKIFGSAAKSYWILMRDFVMYYRDGKDGVQHDAWIYFEYLANECPKKKPIYFPSP